MAYFVNLMEDEPCKVLRSFNQISRSYEVKKLRIWLKWSHTRECTKHFSCSFICIFLLTSMEKEASTKFCDVFDHFCQTDEVTKNWMIKLCLDVVTHPRKWTYRCANCGLRVIFWSFWLMSLRFMMKKDHFKQTLLFWPQVPFKASETRHVKEIYILKMVAQSAKLFSCYPLFNFLLTMKLETITSWYHAPYFWLGKVLVIVSNHFKLSLQKFVRNKANS